MIKYLCDFCNKEIKNSNNIKYISISSKSAIYYKLMICENCEDKFYHKLVEFGEEVEKI